MSNEQLEKGKKIQEQITKLVQSRDHAANKMCFSFFPDMEYDYYSEVVSTIRQYYNNKIHDLQQQFAEL